MMYWISLKNWFSRLVGTIRKAKDYNLSLNQIIFLIQIQSWWGLIYLLKPLLSVQQLVRLAAYGGPCRGKAQPDEVLHSLILFYDICLWAQIGDCLPRALVIHNFLTKAGLQPRLIIGFNEAIGHSWVELGGKPFCESEMSLQQYRPMLTLVGGDKRLTKIEPLKDTFEP